MIQSLTQTVAVDVPTNEIIEFAAPGLRHGDIEADTGSLTVDGVDWAAEYAVDWGYEKIWARNLSSETIPSGAVVVISWEGLPMQATVTDHEARITALEGFHTSGTDYEARIAALETQVNAMEPLVDAHDVKIANHETRISANTTAIDSHEWQIESHEQRISSNTNRINPLETNVTALTAAVAVHDSRLDALEAAIPASKGTT